MESICPQLTGQMCSSAIWNEWFMVFTITSLLRVYFMVSSTNQTQYMKTTTKPSSRIPDYESLAFVQVLRDDKISFTSSISSDPRSNVVAILITILHMSQMNSADEGPWTRSAGQITGPVYNCLPSKVHGLEGGTNYVPREGNWAEGRSSTETAAQCGLTKSLHWNHCLTG